MAGEKILVVDDEPDIQELVRYNLDKAGYKAHCVGTGEECLEVLSSSKYDLILLDLMLPGIEGLEVCRRVKADGETRDLSIVILSAKGEESDIIAGLELGADDYVVKPFSPRILLARIGAVLKRRKGEALHAHTPVDYEEIHIDPRRHEVKIGGAPADLTSTEFKLLHFFVSHPGWVFTRSQIVDAVHGTDYPVTDRSVDVQMVSLRRKLGAAEKYVETVRGVGYRFGAKT